MRLATMGAATVIGAAGIGVGLVVTQPSTQTVTVAQTESGCGVERAAVKHLTDNPTLSAPSVMSIEQLVALPAPAVSSSTPRLPQEHTLVELRGVHVIAAKQEADSDLHVIVSTPTGAELNVESPMARCDSGSRYAKQLADARAALDFALGHVSSSSYTPENITATIQGALFWDVLHGQRGAPNGIELHPVLYFAPGGGPGPSSSPPAPPPPPAVRYSRYWPGCKLWPHRIFYEHRAHHFCRPWFYRTP